MKDGRGKLTRRARYVAEMAQLLAERAERYETVLDKNIEEHGTDLVYAGYDTSTADCGTNVERMIVQLRLELLEMGKMI